MKNSAKIFRVLAALAVSALCLVSCNKPGPYDPEIPVTTFSANHAFGYYYGTELSDKTDHFVVQLIHGALDSEGNLASSGIVVSLDVNAIKGDGKGFPIAKYDCADKGVYSYPSTINPGYIRQVGSEYEIVGSYVGIKRTSSSPLVCYPIIDGTLEPSSISGGGFALLCDVLINGEEFEATYSGAFAIYDQRETAQSFNIAYADFLGDYYENGTNNYDFNLIKGEFDNEGNPVSDYIWLELDWNTDLNVAKWDFFPYGVYDYVAYNDQQEFPPFSFIEGEVDEDGNYYASYIEFYNLAAQKSEKHVVTDGKIDVLKAGNDYNMIIHIVCDDKSSYDFTYAGVIDFADGRPTPEPQATKSMLQSVRKKTDHMSRMHKRPRIEK